jgi:hypothetical protein
LADVCNRPYVPLLPPRLPLFFFGDEETIVVVGCWLLLGSGDLAGSAVWAGECRLMKGRIIKERMNAPTLASVHLGTPPKGYQEWATTKVHIHGFADLTAVRNVPVASSEFMALGSPWCLGLFPGGHGDGGEGWVAIYLRNRSNKSIDMNVGFSIKDGNGKQIANIQSSTHTFGPRGNPLCSLAGWSNFAKRSKLLNALVDGTLVVEVHMKSPTPIKATLPQFIPENPFCNNMLQLFNDDEYSDIVFSVGEHQPKNNSEKVAKIAPVTFHAHSLILTACSAVLCGIV